MKLAALTGALLGSFTRVLTGVRASWLACGPAAKPRLYFANHSSHGDFVLIWACLPKALQHNTRAVAAADYWLSGPIRRYLIQQVFNAVLIDRAGGGQQAFEQMSAALQQGDSLIIFPEGTRNTGDALLPFKSGLFHLAQAHPEVEIVPVWIENLGRTLPKGAYLPVPLLCSVCFGPVLHLAEHEDKAQFLSRARQALLDLSPHVEHP